MKAMPLVLWAAAWLVAVAPGPLAATRVTTAPVPVSAPALASVTDAAAAVTEAAAAVTADVAAPAAPVVNLSGEVVERGTRRPLADAQVIVADLGLTAFTGKDGRFEFEDVPAGVYTIIVPIVGYEKFQTKEEIKRGERIDVRYFVEPAAGNLEIVVEAERVRKEVTRITLKREEITKVPGTNNDALRVVQTLPGVTAVNELRGDMLVRGSGPFDNLILIDRLQIPFAYHFGGLKSVYSSEMLSRIDFYPGGFSAKYGGAMGGVVAAETRPGNPDRYTGFADVNLLLSEGLVEGPVNEKVRFALSGRRSYLDFLAKPLTKALAPPGQYDFTVFPQFYDYQLRADVDTTDEHRFTVFAFGADDVAKLFADVENDREPGIRGDFYVHNAFHNQAVAWNYEPSRKLRLRTTGAYYTVPQEAALGQSDKLDILTRVPVGIHDGEWDHGDSTLRFGLQAFQINYRLDTRFPRLPQRGETDYSFTDAPRISTRRATRLTNASAYVEEIWSASRDLKIIPGVNAGALGEVSSPYADLRLASRFSPVTQTTLKAAVGSFHAYPNPIFLDRDFGNPELLPQRAIHYVAGVEQRFGDDWEASLEGYYKDLRDLVTSNAGGDTPFSNGARGYSRGVEVYLRKNFTRNFFGWVTYSYSQSRRTVPPEATLYLFQYDQPHVANVIASYRFNRAWQVGARWHYASGNPYTPVDGRVYLIDKGFFVPVFSPQLYSRRLPATHRLDLRVDRSWTFDTWKLLLYAEVWNAYLHSNLLGYNYNYDFTKREDIYSFPILPTLGVRGEF